MLKSLLNWWEKVRSRLSDECLVSADSVGFRVEVPGVAEPIAQAQWDDVTRVTAYKRDLFAVDQICVEFRFRDGTSCTVNEEMPGWDELIRLLSIGLPGALTFEAWFEQVAFPAFEPRPTLIYRRAPRANGEPQK